MGNLSDAIDQDEATETQQQVLETAERNPDMKQTEIAEVVGCSDSTVSRTFQEYGDPREDDDSSGGGLLFFILLVLILGGLFLASGGGDSGGGGEGAVSLLAWFITL